MNVQFLVAGSLAMVAAAIHGGGGEVIVLRRVFAGELPSTRFGGPAGTRIMIRVTWHIATLTFLALGAALTSCGISPADGCDLIGGASAISFTGFFGVALVVGLEHPRMLFRHLGPLAFLVIAGLSWSGAS